MKIILSILISLLMTSAFANEDYEGGQTGNGSNGCWFKERGSKDQWKTIEEMRYWNDISNNVHRYSTVLKSEQPIKLKIKPARSVYKEDLLHTATGKRALKRIDKLSVRFPHSYKAIKELSRLLSNVTVLQFEVNGLYEGDITKFMFRCKRFSPAMITQDDGKVFVFRPVWNEISNLTAEIVLVHEMIRFAQTLHPGFDELSNEELQRLTALLFSKSNETFFINRILERIEHRLKLYN